MNRTVALWLSGIALGLGLLIGLMPTSASGASCGSAFVGSNDATVDDMASSLTGGIYGDAAEQCDRQTSILRLPAIGLALGGAIGLLALLASRPIDPKRPMRGITVIDERPRAS